MTRDKNASPVNVQDGIRKNALSANVNLSHDTPLALDDLVDDLDERKKVPPVIPRGAQINYGKHTAHIPSKWRLTITGLLLGAIALAVQPHLLRSTTWNSAPS